MTMEYSLSNAEVVLEDSERYPVASYERELATHRRAEVVLRNALALEKTLVAQRDKLIQQQTLLSQEADHRLLNGLQMIVSLLSLQGRASQSAEAASQLATAADRVATIGRIHQRLHSFDGVHTFAFKQYLDDLCRDFSMMISAERPARVVIVEGIEIKLLAVTAIPLGFVVNEMITNAIKYGTGPVTVSLQADSKKGYALSVANDGEVLPEGFDSSGRKGLGMRIIRSLVKQVGGELRIGRSDGDQGARFTVLFS